MRGPLAFVAGLTAGLCPQHELVLVAKCDHILGSTAKGNRDMRTIQPDTQPGRLLRVLADGRWHGGPDEFGNDFHTARNRINKELKEAGFACESQRRDEGKRGWPWHEYRLESVAAIWRARQQIAEWDRLTRPWLFPAPENPPPPSATVPELAEHYKRSYERRTGHVWPGRKHGS